MRKKTLITLSIAAVATVSGYGGMKTYLSHSKEIENLSLVNVEALANGGENGDDKDNDKYHHIEKVTIPGNETYHYVEENGRTFLCKDIETITQDLCFDPGGVLICDLYLDVDIEHTIIGEIIFND